ncbi:hypothetical protein [Bacterioplanoides pacificum]|jgi:hypothetical protein|uniref:Uncharacterized protein n=1 Tax=Bacterioplanoides pacificum TaxID=1171596 RepID=A0ABV7VQV5_9GAMM
MKKLMSCIALSSALVFNAAPASAAFSLSGTDLFSSTFSSQSPDANEVDQEALQLVAQLLQAVPQLSGVALGQGFNSSLGNLSGLSSGEVYRMTLADGLDVSLSNITLAPIGASVNFYFDDYPLIPASDNTEAINVSGPVSGSFAYRTLTQKISLNLDSVDDQPVIYSGGALQGTMLEFDNLRITINTAKYIPFWEEPVKVEGRVYINGVMVPVEELVTLIKLLSA